MPSAHTPKIWVCPHADGFPNCMHRGPPRWGSESGWGWFGAGDVSAAGCLFEFMDVSEGDMCTVASWQQDRSCVLAASSASCSPDDIASRRVQSCCQRLILLCQPHAV